MTISIFKDFAEIRNQDRARFYFILFVCAFWCNACFLDFCTVVIDKFIHFSGSRDFIKPLLFVVLAIKSWPYLNVRISSKNWLFFFCFGGLYLLNFVLFPQNDVNLTKYLPDYFYAFLFFFSGVSIDIREMKRFLWYASVLNLLCSAFYNLVFIQSAGYSGGAIEVGESVHDMPQAYYVLPSVIYVIWFTIENFHFSELFKLSTLVNIALSVLGFLLESSFGTRGPVVCIIAFVVLYVLIVKKTKHQFIYRFFIVTTGVVAYQFLNEFLLFMAGVTSAMGMSSRIFILALDNTFTQGESSSDERWMMIKMIKEELGQNSVEAYFGHGFTGFWDRLGGYPHNVVYEFLLTFGIIAGGFFILYIAYLLIKTYRKGKSAEIRGFLLVLISCGLVKLFMSSTFISETMFFMLIGYCISVLRNGNYLKYNHDS